MSVPADTQPGRLALHVVDEGSGPPVFFQHGLGGDRLQVAESFPPAAACRRLTIECRGHGLTGPDPERRYSMRRFADDIVETADRLGIDRFAIGGISMGAALAGHIAVHHPHRVAALMLVRPAWVVDKAPENMQPFVAVAHHLKAHGKAGRDSFARSAIATYLGEHAPDNLASLLGFFGRDDTEATADLLLSIALDGPEVTEAQLAALAIPTLVVGHALDHVHPLSYARKLASIVPGACLAEITPKAVDKTRYLAELHATLGAFLTAHVISMETQP